ncbi:unnamed protein product [Amoebophrya sp. A25]|nr:unnamed protein product [Amoebophrya sp. A25]|eukprot:GSA25T00025067001.1
MQEMGVPEASLGGHAFHTYKLKTSASANSESVEFCFHHNVCGRRSYCEGTLDAVEWLRKKIHDLGLGDRSTASANKKVFNMIDVISSPARPL